MSFSVLLKVNIVVEISSEDELLNNKFVTLGIILLWVKYVHFFNYDTKLVFGVLLNITHNNKTCHRTYHIEIIVLSFAQKWLYHNHSLNTESVDAQKRMW